MSMKTATLLLGLATTAAAAPTHHPLCHGDGSPACGNIGQAGRPTRTEPTVMAHGAITVVTALAAAPVALVRLVPVATTMLVAAAAPSAYTATAGRPLRTADDNYACGNVMSKRASSRACARPSALTASAESSGEEP